MSHSNTKVERRAPQYRYSYHSSEREKEMDVHPLIKDTTGVVHRWVFDFELVFFNEQNYNSTKRFIENWWWLCFPYTLLYIILIFIGQAWMSRKNEKYELRQLLILWNAILTIFSFFGACRCVPEFIHVLTHQGFMYSICDSTYKHGISGLW